MRLVYLSRRSNRSGYRVLEHLLDVGGFEIAAVVVPPNHESQRQFRRLDYRLLAPLERFRYRLEVAYYRGEHLRFEESLRRLARTADLPCIEMPTLKDEGARQRLRSLAPDLLVFGGGWPELIPPATLEVARLGAVNTHPSLLPDFRGTDVHRWQVRAGTPVSGTTIHYMDGSFDTGGILGQARVNLQGTEKPQELFDASARVAGPLMVDVLRRVASSAPSRAEALRQPDRDSESRYYSRWSWSDHSLLAIDWCDPADRIERLVRAASQESYRYTGPFFEYQKARTLVRRVTVVAVRGLRPGLIALDGNRFPIVGTGTPTAGIRLDVVQPDASVPNRHRARAGTWLTNRLREGDRLALKPLRRQVPGDAGGG